MSLSRNYLSRWNRRPSEPNLSRQAQTQLPATMERVLRRFPDRNTTMPRDPYEVLGLSKSATTDEIQKAYRKLSKKYHPDRNPGDKQADASYKEVQEAYGILGDPTKKANYDQFGFAGPQQGGFPGGGFPGGFPGAGGFPGGFPGGGE